MMRKAAGNKVSRWTGAILSAVSSIFGQETAEQPQTVSPPEFILQSNPLPMYQPKFEPDYNLKWGPLMAHFQGGIGTEFNDNITLANSNRDADLSFSPNLNLGFIYPLNADHLLKLNIGAGYRFYLDRSDLNSIQLTPDSRLDYRFRVGPADILVYETFYVQADPVSRPELSGVNQVDTGLFRRFNNVAGFRVELPIIKRTRMVGGYDHILDRSLTDAYKDIDRMDHIFSANVYHTLNSRMTVGLGSTYTIIDFSRKVQNDGHTISVGPTFTVKLGRFVDLDLGLNYTSSEYDQTGSVSDRSDFSGVTWNASLNHQLNSKMMHYLRVQKTVNPGLGSNFTEQMGLQYGLVWRARSSMTFNSSFMYEMIDISGGGEESDRFLWYFSTGLALSRQLTAQIAYALALKESNISDRNYFQNRLTLDLRYDF